MEVFSRKSYEEDMEKSRGCFRHLRTIFQELEECRAFELLKVCILPTPSNHVVAWQCKAPFHFMINVRVH